jgi:hypothetical protein
MSIKELQGLDELFDYKNQLIGDLLSNPEIVRLLSDDCKLGADPESFMYTQVFPYEYVPDTVEHAQTIICCEVDIKEVVNKFLLRPAIYVWVFTHADLLRLPEGGVRVDKLSSEISKTLNGSRMYGMGELELVSCKRFSPTQHYAGRTLTFYATDYNRIGTIGKTIPHSRK